MRGGSREDVRDALGTGTRILVTGAGGFIASRLLPRLLERGCEVLAQEPARFGARVQPFLGRLRWLDGAWEEPLTEERAAEFAPEIVFHLAGFTDQSHSRENERRQVQEHLGAALAVVRACFRPALRRLVHAGSNEEYGASPVPHREDAREQPVSAYSAAKTAVTHYFQMLQRSEGLPVVIVRPFLVYGPGQARGLVCEAGTLALQSREIAATAGSQTRDFVYVDDVVEGMLRAATVPGIEGGIFNLGTGAATRIRDAVSLIAQLAGGSPRFGALPMRPGEMMESCADTRRAREVLGWSARVGLEEGLHRTLDDLRRALHTPTRG